MSDMTDQTSPLADALDVTASFDRRGLFRIGGLTITAAALMAACGKTQAGTVGRVGVGSETPTTIAPVVNDGVLLRTAASLETSIANAYDHMLKAGALAKTSSTYPNLGDQTALITTFAKQHVQAAEKLNSLAQEAGAEAWTCGNSRLDSAFITPIFDRVEKGDVATDTAKAIAPSDDPTRDMINLVLTLENLSAESCQALVPQVSDPSFRAEAMRIGGRSARQATLTSLRVNPGAYVSDVDATNAQPGVTTTTEAATTTTQNIAAPSGGGTVAPAAPPQTEIPLPIAIPSQFGSLAPITYVGGLGDENGVRLKLNFETPSLNSLEYPFDTCA